ncbi:MAG: hypothetical protein FJY42_04605 [Betaproteobacteria bacterium]|nr:hypothetical protein [Betaproteobacteria bacterium]
MKQTLSFPADAPAPQQLLAVCLVLRQALRRHQKLELSVPLAVQRQVSEALFGAIIFDTLAAEFSQLDNRLQIKVRPVDHFSIMSPSTGDFA